MRRVFETVLGLLTAASVVGVGGCTVGDSGDPVKPVYSARAVSVPENAGAMADQVVSLVNAIRAQNGLKPYRVSPLLSHIAEDYAQQMIEKGFFDHVDPTSGDGPLKRALQSGYLCLAVGENLAASQTSPEKVVEAWMASTSGHRENILSHLFDEVGAAVRTGGDLGAYWVIEFGVRP